MTSSSKYTAFGASLSNSLRGAGLKPIHLAKKTEVSPVYISNLMTGRKLPSAEWVELISNTLNLSDAQREELHRNAAKAHGFKLDLTKP